MESDSTAYNLMSLQQDFPDELPSWDFAEDVLGGFDQFLDVSSFSQVDESISAVRREQSPAAAEPAGPPDRYQMPTSSSLRTRAGPPALVAIQTARSNGKIGKHSRDSARTESLEAQVALTAAQVQELQASQRQLEARNALLESVASNLTSDAQEASVAEADWSHLPASASDQQRTLVLSVTDGVDLVRTVQDISRMPFTEFVSLYTAYTRKIRQCLTQIAQQKGSTSDTMEDLHKWTSEVSAMLVFLAVGNLRNYLSFTSSRLDGNIGPSVSQLPDTFYQDFVTRLHLTEAQKIDLMHLRRLFYAKMGALKRERKQLLQHVPAGAAQSTLDASTRLADITAIAQQLHDNSAAEFKTYMQFGSAYRRGILTLKQQAVCTVKGFPYIPDKPRILEILAHQRSEMPILVLSQPLGIDDFEHHTNWQLVVNYLRMITKDNLHLYLPLTSSS
ncbi:TPA: hypothetical protein ACH3X1_001309 [Trebouxia sp. C0004]